MIIVSLIEIIVLLWAIYIGLKSKSINDIILFISTIIICVPVNLRFRFINGLTVHSVAISFLFTLLFIRHVIDKKSSIKVKLPPILIPYLYFLIYAISLSYYHGELSTMGAFFSNWITLLFVLQLVLSNENSISVKALNFIPYITIGICIYAIVEFILKQNFVYGSLSVFSNMEVYRSTYRATGTAEHALPFATYLLMLLPIIRIFYKKDFISLKLFLLCTILLPISILLTGSRSASVILLLYIVFTYINIKRIIIVGTFLLFSLPLVLVHLENSPITRNLIYRFKNESGSSEVRFRIFERLQEIVTTQFWGNGLGTSGPVYSRMFYTSDILENPWLTYILDIGVAGFVIMSISILVLLYQYGRKKTLVPMYLVTFIMVSTYNSFGAYSNHPLFVLLIAITLSTGLMKSPNVKVS